MASSTEQVVYAILADDGTVTALVAAAKIFHVIATPNTTGDYITIQRISNTIARHQGGDSDLSSPRVQVDCWSDTTGGAKTLKDAVVGALDNVSGNLGPAGATLTVRRILHDDDRQLHEPVTDGSKSPKFRVSMDYIVWHRAS